MGIQGFYGDRLRQRIRSERERRGWSQAEVAGLFPVSFGIYPSTIAKIESGDRSVRPDELIVIADALSISLDALVGRSTSGSDLVWSISRLTSTAHRLATQMNVDLNLLADQIEDVQDYGTGSDSAKRLIESGFACVGSLQAAQQQLTELAGEFPLVGS